MGIAYISLGSNIEPEKHLRAAVAELRERFDDVLLSPIYRTPAVGFEWTNAVRKLQRFEEAAVEYERAAYGYAGNPDAPRAGYAALVAYAEAESRAAESRRAEVSARAVESALQFAACW